MTSLELKIHQRLIADGLTYSVEELPIVMRVIPLDDVIKSTMDAIKDHMGW